MTYVVAPTLTGYPAPGVVWLPDQWLAMMRGEPMDLTQPDGVKGEPDQPPAAGEAAAYLTITCRRCGYGGTERTYEDQGDGTWLCSACLPADGERP
jgi:hypothetical protein